MTEVLHEDLPTDLSALAWVADELKRTLEAAHKALRRHLRDADSTTHLEPTEGGVPIALQQARTYLHQGAGALVLVEEPEGAQVLQAGEQAILRFSTRSRELDATAVATIERASFALLDYLRRRLLGKPVAAVALFPQYRALQELAGADRVHPADLWRPGESPGRVAEKVARLGRSAAAFGVPPLPVDAHARGLVEQTMLALLRGPVAPAAAQMGRIFAGLAAGAVAQDENRLAGTWVIAAGFHEAQAQGLVAPDLYVKRLTSRLLSQVRLAERGQSEVSERLLQDLLFFCSRVPAAAARAPHLKAVRRTWPAGPDAPVDYERESLGRYDPALIPLARRRVDALKETWSMATAGQPGLGTILREQAVHVADSVRKLDPEGDHLARALDAAAAQVADGSGPPSPGLAMEVATSLLCLDAALDDADVADDAFGQRIQQLARRIDLVREGEQPGPIEPWMEDLYRRASDRQTMGSVVQELRSSLAEVELQLDKFNRNPKERDLLIPVPAKLSAMRGVLSVLGLDQAGSAVVHMRDEIDAVLVLDLGDEVAARAATEGAISRLAANLGALGFLIDLLAVQPHLAKSLFRFDAGAGRLEAVMGRTAQHETPAQAEPPAAAPLLEQVQTLARGAGDEGLSNAELMHRLDDLKHQAVASDQRDLAEAAAAARSALARADGGAAASVRQDLAQAMTDYAAPSPPAAPTATPDVSPTATAEDEEMLGIFFEEAAEVLEGARAALARLVDEPGHFESLATVRRAFHTLKGSARMVGLKDFGEAAWACEQLYNSRLADAAVEIDPTLHEFSRQAFDELGRWVDALVARDASGFHSAPLVRAANALRSGATGEPQAAPAVADHAMPATRDADFGADLPLDDDEPRATIRPLNPDFSLDLPNFAEASASVPSDILARAHGDLKPLDFALDLSALDGESEERSEHAVDTSPSAPVALPAIDATGDGHGHEAAVRDPESGSGPEPAESGPETSLLPPDDAENYKVIGPLRIGIGLFNVFLNEADEQSRRLCTNLAEWALELPRPVGEEAVALAHSLGGNSATVGHAELSALARRLEHALEGSQVRLVAEEEAHLYGDVAEEIRRLLHQFAAGFLQSPHAALLARLDAFHPPAPEAQEIVEDDFLHASIAASHPEPLEEPRVQEDAPVPFVVPEVAAPAGPAAAVLETGLGAVRYSTLDESVRHAAEAGPDVTAGEGIDDAPEFARDLDAVDAIDLDLFEVFVEEAHELLPRLSAHLRAWEGAPAENDHAFGAMRALHTLKGSARLAGAMRLGEIAHRLETAFENRVGGRSATPPTMEQLHAGVDALGEEFERLQRAPQAVAAVSTTMPAPGETEQAPDRPVDAPDATRNSMRDPGENGGDVPAAEPAPQDALPSTSTAESLSAAASATAPGPAADAAPATRIDASSNASALPTPSPSGLAPTIDWTRFSSANPARPTPVADARALQSVVASVRVRAPLLDRLVNQAGEVSITRSRLESEVGQMRGALRELTDNLERLRGQLRDIEVQADSQIASRLEANRSAAADFDPLEMDRFTRFQELTRMMAESVDDVATVQRSLVQTVQSAEDEMAVQARLTRALSEDLLRARMVPFDTLSERLYRVVRQAAKETGVQVRLNIDGSAIELDRSVLDRVAGALEHLLRNAIVHGIEPADVRRAQDKDPVGTIDVSLAQQGNEVRIEIRDDGSGLDLQRIEARGRRNGLIAPDAHPTEGELANLIFTPGFTTAENVTELAGRGVGMDVVRADVTGLGGRIETASAPCRGTAFSLLLPLTTAVTRVVQLRCGDLSVAVPASLIDVVRRVPVAAVEAAYAKGVIRDGEHDVPFFWLGALLQASPRGALAGKTASLVFVRSAEQRVALHVDAVVGNQEVVVKNLGPQLARLPGLAGMSLLATGEVVPIYNPVALAVVYGHRAAALAGPAQVVDPTPEEVLAPLVLVVDDSLTVRRITQRLLVREGLRVTTAKDGLDALERLVEERPAVILSDIEMPRMDGFDLLRNIRRDARWQDVPVIM
ncbi:MAG TPA: Hpt domain-containing protein, partial [Burkholderiaceae bacterium]|nr:Hpt domain-containing protein [Burkholderiaceae bacterium]